MGIEDEKFYEEITMKAVTDTVAKLLNYPFGFHGDTGIRDFLYARLHFHGGQELDVDGPEPKYSTLLLQSEHYTLVKYKNTGKTGKGARFDIALTSLPNSPPASGGNSAENLDALFAFELGRNKPFKKVIDPDMLNHTIDTIPGTSDISKLYLELRDHGLRQGWAIEFYDSKVTKGAPIISKTLGMCKDLRLEEGKKLIIIFVEFSPHGKHHVSSNDPEVESSLIGRLAEIGIDAGPDLASYAKKPAPSYQRQGWGYSAIPSASVEKVFEDRAKFANRIIRIGAMEECGRSSQYVNLSFAGKRNIAQIHPHQAGIALVLRSIADDRPGTFFTEIPVASLSGYKGSNAAWLDGVGPTFKRKGPAIAFLIPDEIDALDGDAKEWQEVVKLLNHAKTLA